MGKLGRKLKKAALKTVRFAHKITHEGPIGKLHDKIAKMVPAPFDSFVKIGTASSKQIHKMMRKTGILKKDADPKKAEAAAKQIRDAARSELRKRASAGDKNAQRVVSALKKVSDAKKAGKLPGAAGGMRAAERPSAGTVVTVQGVRYRVSKA